MVFFIHPNKCLIFFHDPDHKFTLKRLKQVFKKTALGLSGDKPPFRLQCGTGPVLFISLTHGEEAAILAGRLMGRARKHRALAATCDAYIEITFESLDEVLDEINTLIEVQATLQDATQGLLYRSWNRTFSGPDD